MRGAGWSNLGFVYDLQHDGYALRARMKAKRQVRSKRDGDEGSALGEARLRPLRTLSRGWTIQCGFDSLEGFLKRPTERDACDLFKARCFGLSAALSLPSLARHHRYATGSAPHLLIYMFQHPASSPQFR